MSLVTPFLSISASTRSVGLALAILLVAGCTRDVDNGAPASAAAATTKSDGQPSTSQQGARPDADAGGRRAASIVLAASDVKTVERGTIEAGVPISGDLKAIEESAVRARLEGDLVGVYVREGDRVRKGQLLARFEDSEQESDRVSAVGHLDSTTASNRLQDPCCVLLESANADPTHVRQCSTSRIG